MHKTGSHKTLSHWPSPQDYNEAVQNPEIAFNDFVLKFAAPELDRFALPKPVSGGFASVYKLTRGTESWAVRCFLCDVSDLELRYNKISQYLQGCAIKRTTSFQYLPDGIKMNDSWYPVLKMSWIEGQTLDSYIQDNLENSSALRVLCKDFLNLCKDLRQSGIAHGDLQHGNILVTGEGLMLVDYDGMFVPSLNGLRASELGHRNYQHPRRREHHFGNYLDNFSQWVIYTSLASVARDPNLFKELGGGEDCLLFRQGDFAAPQESRSFATLENHPDSSIVKVARFLREQTYRSVEQVEPLHEYPAEVILPKILVAPVRYTRKWQREQGVTVNEGFAGGTQSVDIGPNETPSDAETLHQLERELSQSLPRRVRMNFNNGRVHPLNKQLLFMCFPHFWVPVIFACFCIQSSILIAHGHDIMGTVTNRSVESYNAKDGSIGHRYNIQYKYTDLKGDHTDYRTADKLQYDKLAEGSPVLVRVFEPLPFYDHEVRFSAEEKFHSIPPVFVLFPFGMIMVGIEIALWHEAFKHFKLIRYGTATSGRVGRKWIDYGPRNSQLHRCSYEFSADGRMYSGVMNIDEGTWKRLKESTPMTVIYDASAPSSSCVYRFAHFEAA